MDQVGRVLARRRFPDGLDGIARLHALIGEHLVDPADGTESAAEVVVGIETDRGPWVSALVAAGYTIHDQPMSAARYRERHSTSGAKSYAADAHLLVEIVGADRAHHRQVAADTPGAEAVKPAARSHQTMIWERTRHLLRLRSAFRESFPAALRAFEDLAAPDALEVLRLALHPDTAAQLTRAQIVRALRAGRRRNVEARAEAIRTVLRAPQLVWLGRPREDAAQPSSATSGHARWSTGH